jgi:hypothetical protein
VEEDFRRKNRPAKRFALADGLLTVFSDVDEQFRQKIGMNGDYLGSSQETLQNLNVKSLDLFLVTKTS